MLSVETERKPNRMHISLLLSGFGLAWPLIVLIAGYCCVTVESVSLVLAKKEEREIGSGTRV